MQKIVIDPTVHTENKIIIPILDPVQWEGDTLLVGYEDWIPFDILALLIQLAKIYGWSETLLGIKRSY